MSVTKARELITCLRASTHRQIVRMPARVRSHAGHHKYAWVFMGVALLIVGGVYFRKEFTQAATYTFTQASWAGGATATTATHASNQSGWTQYASSPAATNVTVGTTVTLPSTNDTFIDDVATSTGSGTVINGGGFSSGTFSSTVVSGGSVWIATTTESTALPAARHSHTASILSNGRVLITGGYDGSTATSITYLGTVSGDTITWVASTALPAARYNHTASILSDGRVLITGGYTTAAQSTTYLGTVSGDTITWVASTALPAARDKHTASILSDGRVLITGGAAQSTTYLGTVSGDTITWVASTALPAARHSHTASILSNGRVLITGGFSTAIQSTTYLGNYTSSGTFTSAVVDFGRATIFTNFSWTSTTPAGTSITTKVRSSADNSTWTAWSSCSNITSGANMSTGGCVTNGHRYLQYQATLNASSDLLLFPTLDSVTLNNTQYSASTGDIVSSIYDTQDATNLVTRISWTGSATSSTETIKLQVRSSADGATWSNWCGSSTACAGSDYFLYTDSGVAFATNHPLRSGGNDRYFQYRAFFNSGGAVTPVLESVSAQYVVNAAPNFDTTYGTNGISVTQVSDSTSADWGKVTISYRVRDRDTSSGTTNPGYFTPSFEYSTNSGTSWTALSANLASGDTANKVVQGCVDTANCGASEGYTTYTATWTASSTLASTYNTTMKVRVTVNDNEAANNTASATSAVFTLDAAAPTVGAGNAILDSSTGGVASGTLILSATDNNTLQYRFCNNSAFPSTDAQGNSCAWSTLATSPIASTTVSWVPTGAPSAVETVYLQVRDAYGNVTERTIIAPVMPANFAIWDTSNTSTNTYREFLSWASSTPSTFGAYKVYHSTDGSSYSILATITDQTQNYYTHSITTATSSTHYYKMTSVSSNADISEFSGVLSDIPDGSGGTDITAPYIPAASITASSVRNTSVNIAFSTYTDSSLTTGELSTSTVRYASYSGSAPTTCPTAYSTVSNTYTTNHSIYLTGLTPSTNYVFCVLAKDISGNVSTPSSVATAGGTFTTVGGPRITGVTVRELTDTSATIFWNTDTSSDSKVYYATSASGVNSSTPVASTTVITSGTNTSGTFYQHQIGLTGLTSGTTNYYKVVSADTQTPPNTSTDDNTGQYYSFVTLKDMSPPTITGIATPVTSASAVVVVWQTDEPATSQVLYGGSTGDRSRYTVTDLTHSIYHVVTLSSATTNAGAAGGSNELSASTPYYYVVKSVDAAGNPTTSAEQTVTTPSSGTIIVVTISRPATNAGDTPDTTAPAISNVKVADITPFGATVSFDTDEDADGFVEYGKDASYGDTAGDKTWAKTHTVKLRGLTLGSEYRVKATAHDKAGNTGTSAEQTFKTTFLSENLKDLTKIENIEAFQKEIEDTIESILPSLVPPFISKPQVSDITESSATVTFRTNIKAFPLVGYVEDGAYSADKENPYTGEVSDTENKATEHTVKLAGLKPNTKYHYQARAFSLPQVIGKSADLTFITKAAKIAGSIVERKKDSFTVVWTTTEPTTSIVEYKNLKNGVTERKVDDARRTSHSMKIENLPSGTTYDVSISGLTEQGNTVEAGSPLSVTTSTDTTAPAISGFKVDNALVPGRTDRIQTIVSWETDEPANGTVYYEEGAGTTDDVKELVNKNEVLDSYVIKHSIILPSLKPGTIYRLKVTSSDDSGNEGSFGPRTVITPRQTESITDIIFKNFEDSFKFLRQI